MAGQGVLGREYRKGDGIPIRICKNCGRYFAIAGRISVEYCDRPIDEKGCTCKVYQPVERKAERR